MFRDYSKLQLFIIGLISIVFMALALIFGKHIPLKDQWVLFEALRNTSAIIFAVIGAWFAIVYPERLKFKKSQKTNGDNRETNFDRFFHPLISSSIVLVIILILSILLPTLKTIPYLIDHKEVGRSLIYFTLTTLTIWQILSILAIIQLSDLIKSVADEIDSKDRMRLKINKSGSTISQEELEKFNNTDD